MGSSGPLSPSATSASGYTLPVWVAAAARSALDQLLGLPFAPTVELLLDPPQGQQKALIEVACAALLEPERALAMTTCLPGDGLDLTRDLPVWVEASWLPARPDQPWMQLEAGEGVGVAAASGDPCVSAYAQALLECNLRPLLPPQHRLRLRLTLPGGRALAERTSNAAFGVVDGLALIGTQARVQRSADPDQLQRALAALSERTAAPAFAGDLVLVIGENGLDLAPRLGLPQALLLKAGNWLGPLLVAAAERGVRRLLLFGYQGKLIKLAGGIFHTHHHLADARLEVLTALAVLEGLPLPQLQALMAAQSVEGALTALEACDANACKALCARLAAAVEQRSVAYLARHGQSSLLVGAVLFDRRRQLRACGPQGALLLEAFRA